MTWSDTANELPSQISSRGNWNIAWRCSSTSFTGYITFILHVATNQFLKLQLNMKTNNRKMEQDYICKEQLKGKSAHWLHFAGHSGHLHHRGMLPDLIIKSKTFIWLRPQATSPVRALPPSPPQASKPQPTFSPASRRCCLPQQWDRQPLAALPDRKCRQPMLSVQQFLTAAVTGNATSEGLASGTRLEVRAWHQLISNSAVREGTNRSCNLPNSWLNL